ncbi:hypothetical protein JW916_06965 [Candidatus Sumerlaeota bacterium]|nr:hypothetical protein [Candidatus Sumerlaeota bacterium]
MSSLALFQEGSVWDLTQILDRDDPGLRASAAFTLGKFGKKAHRALPALKRVLEQSRGQVRDTVERAIATIEGVSAEPTPERCERDFQYLIEQLGESARRRTAAEREHDREKRVWLNL